MEKSQEILELKGKIFDALREQELLSIKHQEIEKKKIELVKKLSELEV